MFRAKCYIGSKAIQEYENDLSKGISLAAVEDHAVKRIAGLRKKNVLFAKTAADHIENWLIHKLNP